MTNRFHCVLATACGRQRGFTSVEYVMVTLVVFGALFLPIPGAGGLTPVGMLMAGLRNFQMHTTFLLSMP